ncbi:MAG: hypothetical protein IPG85_10235 [Bacteroidetes bacterium]|nr:hypothetical protein [Bacteroidota bacterium]
MMACRHANGYDWWLVKQGIDTNKVFTFLVTKDTIELKHIQIFAAPKFGFYDLRGQACFSSDGSKYAFATGGEKSNGAQLYIADFDRCSGLLSNPKTYNVPIEITNYPYFDNMGRKDSLIYGVCFLPMIVFYILQSPLMFINLNTTTPTVVWHGTEYIATIR